jgi:hypothetical protein
MDHPSIVSAFQNAYKRNKNTIHMVFKRTNIFYKNTYIILSGTSEKIKQIIDILYHDVQEYKKENSRGDHDQLDDTPFDTWCGRKCVNISKGIISECPTANNVSCCSHWEHFEYASEQELNDRVENISTEYSYYNLRSIIDYRLFTPASV